MGLLNTQFAADQPGYEHKSLSGSAINFVKSQPWNGNVRQLYNALTQAAVLTDGKIIGREEIAASIAELPNTSPSARDWIDRPLGDGFDLEEHLNSIRAIMPVLNAFRHQRIKHLCLCSIHLAMKRVLSDDVLELCEHLEYAERSGDGDLGIL